MYMVVGHRWNNWLDSFRCPQFHDCDPALSYALGVAVLCIYTLCGLCSAAEWGLNLPGARRKCPDKPLRETFGHGQRQYPGRKKLSGGGSNYMEWHLLARISVARRGGVSNWHQLSSIWLVTILLLLVIITIWTTTTTSILTSQYQWVSGVSHCRSQCSRRPMNRWSHLVDRAQRVVNDGFVDGLFCLAQLNPNKGTWPGSTKPELHSNEAFFFCTCVFFACGVGNSLWAVIWHYLNVECSRAVSVHAFDFWIDLRPQRILCNLVLFKTSWNLFGAQTLHPPWPKTASPTIQTTHEGLGPEADPFDPFCMAPLELLKAFSEAKLLHFFFVSPWLCFRWGSTFDRRAPNISWEPSWSSPRRVATLGRWLVGAVKRGSRFGCREGTGGGGGLFQGCLGVGGLGGGLKGSKRE